MVVSADTLRDRLEDVIADMERQFVRVSPALEALALDALAGNRAAYRELQAAGRGVLAPLIDHYGLAAGALAADWYDFNRDALKVGGAWSGAIVQDANIDTGPMVGGSVKDFVSSETVLAGIQAGMDLRVRQAAQGTLMDSILRDPRARGWGRVASAGCCSYCAMLAGRGAVYRTRQTATFCPHTSCRCQALPLWQTDPTGESMRSRADTIATRRALSDKQRRFQNEQARQWIADNRAQLGLVA